MSEQVLLPKPLRTLTMVNSIVYIMVNRDWTGECGTHYLSPREPTIVPKSIEDPNPAIKSLPISPWL
jgi:hypothetical protein